MGTRLIALLRSEWSPGAQTIPGGSVISVELDNLVKGNPGESLELIYSPDAVSSVEGVTVTRDRVYISILSNVTGKLLRASPAIFHTRARRFHRAVYLAHA